MQRIIIATTPKPWSGLIKVIQRNALSSWLRQAVPLGWEREILLFGDDEGTGAAAQEYQVTHIAEVSKTPAGTPNIGAIFSDLQSRDAEVYCYINADIIISNDCLIKTLVQQYTRTPRYTATAARTGLIVTECITNWDYLYAALEVECKTAVPRCGVDIFIFTRETLPKMPDFALGRGFWDKWFICSCVSLSPSAPFLNLTTSFWTIHQSHDYAHLPIKNAKAWDTRGFNWENGEGKGPETKRNRVLFTDDYPKSAIKQPYVANCVNNGPVVRRSSGPAVQRSSSPVVQRSYHLLPRRRAGTKHHRNGWPWICDELTRQANGGMLLDDFVSQSFEWGKDKIIHRQPWVGIFHHPVTINAPSVQALCERTILNFPNKREWTVSRRKLRGAIALCEESADYLRQELDVPVLGLLHPAMPTSNVWTLQKLRKQRPLPIVQVGEAHRNIRYIYGIATPEHWGKKRLVRNSSTMQHIDSALSVLYPDNSDTEVEELPRLSDTDYDDLLASSVVVQQVYGAAANNTVVDCMVRGTPMIVNRLPALEQYLGSNYPLFVDDPEDSIPEHYWYASNLEKASIYLLERSKILPSVEEFVNQIDEFIKSVN